MPFVNLPLRLPPIIHVTPVLTAPLMPEIVCPLGDLFLEAEILVNLKNRPTFFHVRCCFHIWFELMFRLLCVRGGKTESLASQDGTEALMAPAALCR